MKRTSRSAVSAFLTTATAVVVLTAASVSTTGVTANAVTTSTNCATGTLSYSYKDAEAAANTVDPDTTPSSVPTTTSKVRNANWKLVNKSSGATLSQGLTDASNGSFSACYDSSIPSSSIKIVFESASTNLWRVVTKNKSNASTYFDEHNLTSANFGGLNVDSAKAGAFKIVDTLSSLWGINGNNSTDCWVANQANGQCKAITFAWGDAIDNGTNTDAGTAYWDLSGTKFVVIGSTSTQSMHTIVHEAGHAWQYLLNKGFPTVTNCGDHHFETVSSKTCAWTEGWADAVAAWTLGDHRYVFDDGYYVNLTPNSNWATGPAVQGHIGSTLLQLWAGPDQQTWDGTIKAMNGTVISCFKQYYAARPAAGLATDSAVQQILSNNTLSANDTSSCS
ncbi:hypothetical protein [Psychromicrobium lacuslunae]|uniref:Metalloprotease n=1 Tax=Psychromicrobium lacuslunae TaxID=1618207 RepID=A0A0D4C2X0_9MICC|nr:hypothetical protein [Psychromicrobium lacuslunae]AJT42899.1 hypothetical protein UM93_05195 [Psychromicrobium lacuslunae]